MNWELKRVEASVVVVIEDLFDFSPLFAVVGLVGVVVLIEDELELRPPLVAATNQNPLSELWTLLPLTAEDMKRSRTRSHKIC